MKEQKIALLLGVIAALGLLMIKMTLEYASAQHLVMVLFVLILCVTYMCVLMIERADEDDDTTYTAIYGGDECVYAHDAPLVLEDH